MSNLEHTSKHAAKAAGKTDGCCGGAHDQECEKPESASAKQEPKPAVAGQGTHTLAGHAAGGSCGCGGKHK